MDSSAVTLCCGVAVLPISMVAGWPESNSPNSLCSRARLEDSPACQEAVRLALTLCPAGNIGLIYDL